MPAPKITQNANGSISVEVTIPPSTPPGVYLIAVVGTDARGVSRAIIVPVVVRRRAAASVLVPQAAAKTPSAPVVVPADVRKSLDAVVESVADAGGSTVVADSVLHDDAELVIEDDQLIVHYPGRATDGDSRSTIALAAAILGAAGLVLVRRRTPAISTRSR